MTTLSPPPAIPSALLPVRSRFLALIVPRVLEFEAFRRQINEGGEATAALAGIGALAHKISGVAATLGFHQVGQLAAQVDRRIVGGRGAPLPPVWREVEPQLEALMDAMEALPDA